MKKRVFLAILVISCICTTGGFAQRFTAEAPDAVASGEQFRLSYTVNTQNVKNFRANIASDFSVLSGPNRSSSTSIQIINGSQSSSSTLTFTYILQADKQGTFTIPAATIVADGKSLSSNSVTIRVLPPDKASAARSGGSRSSGGNASQASSSGNSISNQDLFIRTIVNKTTVCEQEAILLTYKIYALVNLTELQGKMPDLNGFHIQEMDLPRNKTWSLEHYNGRNYKTIVWSQYVLFPQQTGTLEIPSIKFDGIVQQVNRSVDPFDAFFNGGSNVVEVKKVLVTPKETIHVTPLPAGKPANFSGGVGDFTISSSLTPDKVKSNEALTLRVVISGTGNLKLIKTPDVAFPKDFETYDPKVDNKFNLKSDGLSGSKVIDYLAIPRNPGTYQIPPVEFSYFDLKTKTYKTLKTEPYTLNIEKGSGSSSSSSSSVVDKEDLQLLGKDIRYIKTDSTSKLQLENHLFFDSFLYYLCYLVPIALFIVFFVIYRKQAMENANTAKVRTKKASKVAVKRMKAAQLLMSQGKKTEFYDEVLRALWGYLSDKLEIPVSRLSKDNIASELSKKAVDSTLISELESTLNDCEFARYAPADTGSPMDKTYSAAVDVISKLDNSIKR